MRCRVVVGIAVALVLATSAWTGEPEQAPSPGEVHTTAKNNLEESQEFERRTDQLEFELSCTEATSSARLQVQAKVKSGAVSWTLTDPDGETRLTARGVRGRIKGDTGDVKSIPGIWILELRLEKATGSYRIDWHAR